MIPERGARIHFDCFDGLRALAAIVVVFHHVGFATGATGRNWFSMGTYLARMDSGVAVFFLISGFLLYRPFVLRRLVDEPRPATRPFLRRRFLRIFPAYWAALVLTGIFVGFLPGQGITGVTGWIVHLFLLQIYDSGRYFHGISQSWTLAVEVSFYVFLPLYAWVIRKAVPRGSMACVLRVELAGLGVLFAISIAFKALVFWGPSSYLELLGRYWLPANLDLFSMGMLLAVASAWVEARGATPKFLERVGRIGGWWWLVGLVAFWTVSTQLGLPRNLEAVDGVTDYVEWYLYGITAFFLLLPAVFGGERGGLVRRGLRWAPVAWLGLISYGVYLWHQTYVTKALQWTDSYVPGSLPHGPFWEVLAIVLACTIPTAALSYYLIERPLMRFKDRRKPAEQRTA